jgi:putative NAD(P)H nitroreductase
MIKWFNDTVSFYESGGQGFQRDEAIRDASLSAMLFMLATKEKVESRKPRGYRKPVSKFVTFI